MSNIETALQQWRAALPDGRVLTGTDIEQYHSNCLGLTRHIVAVIQAASEAEVISIVHIAAAQRVSLYTISTGHNWGYGSAIPPVDGCAILDLSRMNRIVEIDRELGLITLEPGVTQKQLADYLAEQQLGFYVPTTGAGPTTSIVGNALEHGFGITPEEDHFRAVTSVRAVLADGSIYQSCFAAQGAPLAGVWKWGIGPYMDGLFAQANMGIVTALQIALSPHIEHTELCFFSIKDEIRLEQALIGCRSLLSDMRGVLGSIKMLNRTQVESMLGSANLGGGLSENFAWMGFGVVRCRRRMMPAIRKEIRRTLGPHCARVLFVNKERHNILRLLSRLLPTKYRAPLTRQLGNIQYLLDLANGIPRNDALRLVYKHVNMPENLPADPARDGVGVIWYAPVLPMKSSIMLAMIKMIKCTLQEFGYSATISFTIITEACGIGVIPIIYQIPNERDHAYRCFQTLWERGNALGCPPYRMNVNGMSQLTNPLTNTYWQNVDKIKTSLDPYHLLSPGRYAPLSKS